MPRARCYPSLRATHVPRLVLAHTFINPLAVDSPSPCTVSLPLHCLSFRFSFVQPLSSFLSLALRAFILVRAYQWAPLYLHWFEFNGCQTLALCVRRMPPATCSKILPSPFRSSVCALPAKLRRRSRLSLLSATAIDEIIAHRII